MTSAFLKHCGELTVKGSHLFFSVEASGRLQSYEYALIVFPEFPCLLFLHDG